MIEHDPELRDVLNRRRFFKELLTSAAEDSDRLRGTEGTIRRFSVHARRRRVWDSDLDAWGALPRIISF
jgi:hypothetical protein